MEKWPRTVRVVLSGYTQLQQILTTINQADIFKFITKPWKLEEEFKQVISQSLDYYKILEENEENKKALENKNNAYQNILKGMDTAIADAKARIDLVEKCGRAFFDFNKDHFSEINPDILEYQTEIFCSFVEALKAEERELQLDRIEVDINKIIGSKVKISKRDKNYNAALKTRIIPAVLNAVVATCINLFHEEFAELGLYVNYASGSGKSFNISFASINAYQGPDSLDSKILLLNTVIPKCISFCKMSFYASKTKGNIVMVTTIPVEN